MEQMHRETQEIFLGSPTFSRSSNRCAPRMRTHSESARQVCSTVDHWSSAYLFIAEPTQFSWDDHSGRGGGHGRIERSLDRPLSRLAASDTKSFRSRLEREDV